MGSGSPASVPNSLPQRLDRYRANLNGSPSIVAANDTEVRISVVGLASFPSVTFPVSVGLTGCLCPALFLFCSGIVNVLIFTLSQPAQLFHPHISPWGE